MSDINSSEPFPAATGQNMSLEFTVEPFVDASPGPHVTAAIAAAQEQPGLAVDVGPFGTLVSGIDSDVLAATDNLLAAAFANGATRVSLQITIED